MCYIIFIVERRRRFHNKKNIIFYGIRKVFCNNSKMIINPQRRQDITESALLETYHVRAAQ